MSNPNPSEFRSNQSPECGKLMRRRHLLQLLGSTLGLQWLSTGEAAPPLIPSYRYTFGGRVRCIPKHNYDPRSRSPSLVVQSLPVQDFQSAANTLRLLQVQGTDTLPLPDELLPQRKRLRPNRTSLPIDHCRVSHIVLDVHSSGDWSMSLVAEHNPAQLDPGAQVGAPLLRNEFHVSVRLLASRATVTEPVASDNEQTTQPAPGRLVLAMIEPQDFWVQSGRRRTMRWRGNCPDIFAGYTDISGAEFEFYYYLDPLSAVGQRVHRMEGF